MNLLSTILFLISLVSLSHFQLYLSKLPPDVDPYSHRVVSTEIFSQTSAIIFCLPEAHQSRVRVRRHTVEILSISIDRL